MARNNDPIVFKPKSKDADYLIKYQAMLDDVGMLHKYAVDWVKEHEVFEDEQAIHAMAFSIKTEAMKAMNQPNLVVYLPSKDPKQNLIDFYLYRQIVDDPLDAFVNLTAEMIDRTYEQVKATGNKIPDLTRKTFITHVERYDLLAEGIKADLDGDHEMALELWENAMREVEDDTR